MTFKELAEMILSELTEEQQECDLSVYDPGNDEFRTVFGLSDDDTLSETVLDEGHPFIVLKA